MNASTQIAREPAPETQHRPTQEYAHAAPRAEQEEARTEALHGSVERASADGAPAEAPRTRKPRGFAAMDRSLVSAIARKGGKAAHEAGTAHEFTREEAREAGRKGGQATHAKRRAKGEPSSS